MRYTVTGPVPIATSKGPIEPGGTLDEADLDPRTHVAALVAAGHLTPEQKPAEPPEQKPAESAEKKPAESAEKKPSK